MTKEEVYNNGIECHFIMRKTEDGIYYYVEDYGGVPGFNDYVDLWGEEWMAVQHYFMRRKIEVTKETEKE